MLATNVKQKIVLPCQGVSLAIGMNLGSTYVQVKDMVLFGIAVVGAVLGVINTCTTYRRGKVRLKVLPGVYRNVAGGALTRIEMPEDPNERWDGVHIEVMNVGYLPVTVDGVGFERHNGTRLTSLRHLMRDGGSFPRRLEARASFTVFFPGDAALHGVKTAYANTACGCTFRGTSPVARHLAKLPPSSA